MAGGNFEADRGSELLAPVAGAGFAGAAWDEANVAASAASGDITIGTG